MQLKYRPAQPHTFESYVSMDAGLISFAWELHPSELTAMADKEQLAESEAIGEAAEAMLEMRTPTIEGCAAKAMTALGGAANQSSYYAKVR